MATQKPSPAAMAAMAQAAQQQQQMRPVTGPPAPNSDIFLFINAAFRQEFDVCAKLTEDHDLISFECDLVKKLSNPETTTYSTSLRIPRGCMARAKMHPIFRRMLVQSMWLQMQPGMLRYKGKGQPIDPKAPVCSCANPPCSKPAVRFVGNPGFFIQKNMLIDPFCVPVCNDAPCVLQAQQMSNTIHAQAHQQQAQMQQQSQIPTNSTMGDNLPFDMANNPALKSQQMPKSVKSCNMCGSFEQAYGGTAAMLRACPLCGISYYCSQQCQIQDWQRGHKDVCVNAQGKAALPATPAKPKAKEVPATIPEGETPAPAPAPAPMPLRTAPAPAPAPMPKPSPPSQAKPAPSAAVVAATTADGGAIPQLTQQMASMTTMPTYKMPEPAVSAMPQPQPQQPAYGMPTYKMPEPGVASAPSTVAVPTYAGGMPTFQPAPTVATGASPTSTAAAAGAANPAPVTTATTTAATLPIKKGRKKAE